jgi:magnesium transporter
MQPLKIFKSQPKKPGAAPGTVQHIGEKRVENVEIQVYDYDAKHIEEVSIDSIEDCEPYVKSPSNTWINIQGLHDIEKLKNIWSQFDLHPLIQEDIVNTSQRAKMEQYENCVYFVMRMLWYNTDEQTVEGEQISIILGENFVLSFQESDQPIFRPVVDRLNLSKSRIRSQDTDYLAYAIIDTITDHYFSLLGALAEQMEQIEDQLLDDPDEDTFQAIHELRQKIVFCRKSVWPARDMLNSVIRNESPFIQESTKIYFRDVYDHMVQIIDNIDNYRDLILSMHDMYMSHVSNKMNEVMKVLTIIATIFIPLTFIAGIYGMNFDPSASPYNMPELSWYWGYPTAWGIMIVVGIIMVVYFKRKGWL